MKALRMKMNACKSAFVLNRASASRLIFAPRRAINRSSLLLVHSSLENVIVFFFIKIDIVLMEHCAPSHLLVHEDGTLPAILLIILNQLTQIEPSIYNNFRDVMLTKIAIILKKIK